MKLAAIITAAVNLARRARWDIIGFWISSAVVIYFAITGGETFIVVMLLLMVAITAIVAALTALAIVREIYREIIKPLAAAIRRAF